MKNIIEEYYEDDYYDHEADYGATVVMAKKAPKNNTCNKQKLQPEITKPEKKKITKPTNLSTTTSTSVITKNDKTDKIDTYDDKKPGFLAKYPKIDNIMYFINLI